MDETTKKLTEVLCKWNHDEIRAGAALVMIWGLYEKEALETWNNQLEERLNFPNKRVHIKEVNE